MATSINKLSGTDTLTEDDLLPVWVDLQGDTRKASVGRLKTYLEQNLNILGTGATQLSDLTDVIVPNVTDGQVLSYNEAAKQWFAVTIANGGDTDGVTEGTSNLYFTEARARAAVSGTGDIAYNSTTGVFSFSNTSGFITSYTVTQSDVTTHGDPRYLQKTLAQGQVFIGNVSNQAAARALAQSDIANLSTDLGAKLDSSAYTASDVLTKLKTVDGTGSLLDADLLDGQQGTYYLDYGNFTNTPTIPTNNNQLTNGAGYITTYTVTQGDVTAHQAALSITESQISDLGNYSAVTSGAGAPSTAPSALGDIYIDTTNDDAYVAVGTASAADWEKSNDGTGTGGGGGSVTSVSGTGTVSGISLSGTVTTSGSIALGGTLAADTSNITTGTFADARIAQSNVTQHQAALSITESQISDFGTYLTSFTETNDLTAAVTWANVPDANITQSSVTQHQAALSITESQISNFGTYATLVNGTVPASQLPSFVDDVVEAAGTGNFPATGEADKIYVDTSANKTYRWSGTQYVEISASPGSTDDVTEGSTNLYFTNARARAAISVNGSLSYDSGTGVISYTQPTNVSTFTNDSGYITASSTATLTNKSGNISQWTNDSGYLTSETSHADVVVDGDFASQGLMRRGATAGSYSIVTDNSANWNTAFGWGDHAAAGYVTASSTATFTNKSGNISQWTNDSGYTTNTGTVTSVGGTGTVNGLTLTGTVTTSGNLTLGGSVSGGLTGVTSVYNTGLAVGRSAATERIDFGTSGQIGVYLANVEEFRFAAGGTFHADADVVAFSTTVASDEKLKHNIHPITDALEKVQNLTGVTFQYRRDNKQSAGVIAQAVERVMPSAVKEVAHLNDEGTYKSVDYNQLIGLLIEAVKDQQQQIDKLRRMLGA